MSYIMHNLRQNVIRFIRKELNDKKKVPKKQMRAQIMIRFQFCGQTADKYIKELVEIGVIKNHGDNLEPGDISDE